MASSKKTREEEKEKKKTKETKLTKPEIKNKKKSSPKKPKDNNNSNKKKKTNNGAAKKEPEIVTTPSSSADSHQEPESQEESAQEQEKRSEEASNQRSKIKKSKKSRENQEEVDDEDDEKACRFPTKRIWRIVKSQSSGSSITGDAVFLVNKATEKFLEQFCEDAYAQCVKDRKKSLSYQHLASVVSKQRRYDFLSGIIFSDSYISMSKSTKVSVIYAGNYYFVYLDFVPEKIKAEAALAESKLTEKEAGYES
ncbi:hypothetical protein Dsin_020067 [Dipteronia sinensis]|uniref:Transcription factor CBF/NF-Y/archaeal histone domain-containing protein n=1 Tax=Dipteronia sinensis TaxID=43782 RepID=A0AAE0E3N2_9ROSI|nr:hypothetical protein Dsin_020067 [Dipteronia sinensis]